MLQLTVWDTFSGTLIYLLQNVALLFALVFLYGATNFDPRGKNTAKKVILGLLIGAFSMLIMNFPWELEEGIFYDTRSVLLSVTGAFFSLTTTGIAALIAIIYRILLGGAGVYAGTLTIFVSSGLGILFHLLMQKQLRQVPALIRYYVFGVSVSVATLLCQLAIPWPTAFLAIESVMLPYLVFFPVVSLILCFAIENQITRLNSQQSLKQQQLLLEASINSPREMEIYAVDTNFVYLSFNHFHAKSIFKYYNLPIRIGQYYFDNISDKKMADRIRNCFERALAGESFTVVDEVETNKGKFLENFYAPIYNKEKKIMGVTVFSHDITERKTYEQSILYISYHDVLTGLKNRRFYNEELDRIDHHQYLPISIVMADINGLKLMNDAFGHDQGDELLKVVATGLAACFESHGVVARIGGDEFVAIMTNTDFNVAMSLIEQAKARIEEHVLNGMRVSVSFGAATKTDMMSIDETFKVAEDDMYKHKLFEVSSNRNDAIKAIMNTLNMKNPREEEHSRRVSFYCQKLGEILGMRKDEVELLKVIGNLHDIGKIAIDEQILNKPGKLSEEEWITLKRHSEIGYRIISSSADYAEISEDILSHHERWDGKGYPQGLAEEEIPFRARIIAIADAFDAMTSERPYRAKMSIGEAIAEIKRCSGTQFDPDIAGKFIEYLEANQDNIV